MYHKRKTINKKTIKNLIKKRKKTQSKRKFEPRWEEWCITQIIYDLQCLVDMDDFITKEQND